MSDQRRRLGFTMIELLIAVGFSMIIVMVAMMTFRAAQKAMGRLDELAAENKMIRSGYYLALQDADYWQSHADPTYPYMAHFNSADMLSAPDTFQNDANLAGGLQAGSRTWSVNNTQSDTAVFGTVTSPDELANSVWDARCFRRTTWRNEYFSGGTPTFANPNVADASSPLAWYRNHLQQGLTGGIYMRSTRDPSYKYMMNWDFRPECQFTSGDGISWKETDYARSICKVVEDGGANRMWAYNGDGSHQPGKFVTANQVKRIATEKGWSPWHIVGDYSQVSNCEGLRRQGADVVSDYGSAPPGYPSDLHDLAKVADYRPALMWYTQAMLGIYGMFNYMRPGELTLLQVSSVNMTQSSFTGGPAARQALDWRKGEIPWSLNSGGADLTYRREMAAHGGAGADSDFAYPQAFVDEYPLYNRLNYWARMPTRYDMRREQALIGSRYAFLADFDSYEGMGRAGVIVVGGDGTGVDTLFNNIPMALFYPRLPLRRRITLEAYDWSRANWDVIKPLVPLYWPSGYDYHMDKSQKQPITTRDMYQFIDGNHYRVMESRHTCQTWHLPQSYTNDQTPDLRGLGLEGMAMSTAIFRYRYQGNETARCSVMLHKDGSKLRTMTFNVFSTSLRGARQYWGRKSGAAGMDDGFGNQVKIGDYYQ